MKTSSHMSRNSWFHQGLNRVKSALEDSRFYRVVIPFQLTAPLSQALSSTRHCYHPVISFIVGLFPRSYPSNITRPITLRVINSIKCILLFIRGFWGNFFQKTGEHQPSGIDCNSSATIIFPSRGTWSSASLNDIVMNPVKLACARFPFVAMFVVHFQMATISVDAWQELNPFGAF